MFFHTANGEDDGEDNNEHSTPSTSKRPKMELGSPAPRSRSSARSSPAPSVVAPLEFDENGEPLGHFDLTRLGFWECRLCKSQKYMLAGAGRQPSAPGKWPLKDIAKMITHYTELHGEHNSFERCMELGAALNVNRELTCTLHNEHLTSRMEADRNHI